MRRTPRAHRNIIERMLDCSAVEPGSLPLIAGADAAIATELADRGRRLAGDVPTQRCTVHKHRNLLAHASQRPHDVITIRGDSYRLREKRRTGLLKASVIAPSAPATA